MDASPIDSYDALISALRAHIAAIDVTFDSVDTIAGNPTRYAAKILGQPPIRRMTVYTLLNLCAAVGLRLTLTRDDHRLAQLRRRSQWAEPDVSTLVGNPFFRLKKTGPDAAGQENFCAAEIFASIANTAQRRADFCIRCD